MDRREHHRAQLSLPVRLRWTTPFGQRTEVCETQNISRGGLLVPSAEGHAAGVWLWVTFPFDNSIGDGQPEIPAKVVRAKQSQNGSNGAGAKAASAQDRFAEANGAHKTLLGLRFEGTAHAKSNGNARWHGPDRRSSMRLSLSVPVRVRQEHIPWFEEAMSMDVSANGMRIRSSREYVAGESLLISFQALAAAPWAGATEFRARVVRTARAPQSTTLEISVSRAL